jgi:arylsulfatase
MRTTQYFEMIGNRAIYHDGWMAASRSGLLPWIYSNQPPPDPNGQPWELYHLSLDYSEAENLASGNPAKLFELEKIFDSEAKRNNVYPLDPRWGGRQARPGGKHFVYYARTGHLFVSLTPAYENHSHTITAWVDIPRDGGDGVLMADGGDAGGFSLYIKDGKPAYTYNYFQQRITTIAAADVLPPGPAKITLQFAYDGNGVGKGATITLLVNDKPAATARLPETVRTAFSFEETFDIGEDTASAVGPYQSPFPFTGSIEHIDLDIGP